jgi:hypothetical protein
MSAIRTGRGNPVLLGRNPVGHVRRRAAAAAVMFLALAATVMPGAAAGAGEKAKPKKVFYVGTVNYDHREAGTYSRDKSYPGGGSDKMERSVNTSVSGSWGFSLRCATDFAGIVLAAGESEAGVNYSHMRTAKSDAVDASEECPGGREAARPGSRSVTSEREIDQPLKTALKAAVQLTAGDGRYGLLFVSDPLPVSRQAQRTVTVTRRCNPSPPPSSTHADVNLELPFSVAAENKPWGDGLTVAGSQEIDDDEEGGRNFMPPRDAEGSGDYTCRTVLSWSFTRKEADCSARVLDARGDATLNDVPLGKGSEVPLGRGDRIKVGFKGRAELRAQDGVLSTLRFGGGTDFSFRRDPCDPKPTQDVDAELLTGALYSVISKLSGSDSKFEMEIHGGYTGVRGFFRRFREFFQPLPLYAAEPEENPAPENAVLPEGWPAGAAAFYVCASPDGAVGVKVFKGRAAVFDPETGRTVRLQAGQAQRIPAMKRGKPVRITFQP